VGTTVGFSVKPSVIRTIVGVAVDNAVGIKGDTNVGVGEGDGVGVGTGVSVKISVDSKVDTTVGKEEGDVVNAGVGDVVGSTISTTKASATIFDMTDSRRPSPSSSATSQVPPWPIDKPLKPNVPIAWFMT
jgi:hypothetical protein